MNGEVSGAELFGWTEEGDDVAVGGAEGGAFGVDGLRGGDDDFLDGELVVADELEHLGGAEGVDQDVLGHFGHVATVGCLVEDDVDVLERGEHGVGVLDFALAELSGGVDPGGFAEFVGVGLEVVEDADGVAVAEEEVDEMGADEAGAAGDEGALSVRGHVVDVNG